MKYRLYTLLLVFVITGCSQLDRKTLDNRPTIGVKECLDDFGTVQDPDSGVFYYVGISSKSTCVNKDGITLQSVQQPWFQKTFGFYGERNDELFNASDDCPRVTTFTKELKYRTAKNSRMKILVGHKRKRNESPSIIWTDKTDCYYMCDKFTKVTLYKDDIKWCTSDKAPLFGLKDMKIELPEVTFDESSSDEVIGIVTYSK